MKNSFARRLLSVVLLAASAGLVLVATYSLRRNCEGFGCPNAAVLWSAWTAVYLVVGLSGLQLRTRLLPGTPSRRIVDFSLAVLAAASLALGGYWVLVHNAA